MARRGFSKFGWAGAVCALGIILGSCTPGGQFDPTEIMSNEMFNTKKKITGEREPLFPNGVPGTETGVPPDLVKGYQPPPEQAAAVETPAEAAKPVPAAEKPKPKRRPKPAVARATPAGAPAAPPANATWSAPPQQPAPTNWPAPPGAPAQPTAQTNWPAPPPANAQTNWPAPPPPAGQAQQGAQSGQSIWPNPPATSSH